jgi:hypothetical protein
MPNEQTSVPLFTSGEVLTAANMNLSAGTGVPVFATTVTRDAAFGGASEKVLAEGQLCYLSDSNIVQYYTGAVWATVGPATAGALVRVGGGTLSGTSTLISSLFSATYSAYLVLGSAITTTSSTIAIQMGTTAAGYYQAGGGASYAGVADFQNRSNAASWYQLSGTSSATRYGAINCVIVNPNAAQETAFYYNSQNSLTTGGAFAGGGYLADQTQYTSLTFSSTGTMTGTINVYGYSLS